MKKIILILCLLTLIGISGCATEYGSVDRPSGHSGHQGHQGHRH